MRRLLVSAAVLASCLSMTPAAVAVEIIPLAGLGRPTGNGSDGYDLGLHLGVSIGGRPAERISLHGQLNLHFFNFDDAMTMGADVSGQLGLLSFAALFHLTPPGASVDLMLGPTLGLFYLSSDFSVLGMSGGASVTGEHLGFMTAVLVRANERVSVGPYLLYTRMWAEEVCVKVGGTEMCDDTVTNDDEGYFSAGVAASF